MFEKKFDICRQWRITNDEYLMLDETYGKLCQYQAWQLYNKNSRNNHTDEQADIAQDIIIALMKAGSYYKRQIYIEKCLDLCQKHAQDDFIKHMVDTLRDLWKNKTRHGANRQKFGPHQEKILFKLVRKLVPKKDRPNKEANLKMDSKFSTYCKSITWNQVKAMGKKITREKSIRSNQVSLSEFDFLS